MTSTARGVVSVIFAVSAIVLGSCSSGIYVPPAGTGAKVTPTPAASATPTTAATATPVGATPTPTPVGATPTPVGPTPTPTPVGATPTPTSSAAVTPTPTSSAAVTPTPTSSSGSCTTPAPITTTEPWSDSATTIPLPAFGDQTGSIMIPPNNASAGTKLQIQESTVSFTDGGGNGNIPTPAPGEGTAITYSASTLLPAQTITFSGNQTITVSAKAPCEIPFTNPNGSQASYVVDVFVNGGGFSHTELETAQAAPFQSDHQTISFTINLSSSGGLEPSGAYTEVVFIKHS